MHQHTIYTVLLLLPFIDNSRSEQIECTGTEQCSGKFLTCNQDEDCFMLCNGASSCYDATIICPQNDSKRCSITCNDTLSCSHLTISANKASSLNVVSSGRESLSFSHIYCPENSLSEKCNLTYFGSENGLNMIHLYSIHDYDALNINCASFDTCWSNGSNPELHFGNKVYSQTCTIYNQTQCLTEFVPITTIESVERNKLTNYNPQSLKMVIILLLFGASGCILIGIFCCVLFFCIHYCKTHKNRFPNKNRLSRKLSPAMKKLSPKLKPADLKVIDLGDLKIDDKKVAAKTETDELDETATVQVTVQQYANSGNNCDESGPGLSRDSSLFTWFSASKHIPQFVPKSVDILQDEEKETDGIAPDEFVVKSDSD